MIELAKLMLYMNDTAKDYVKDGKPLITEEQFAKEFHRRENSCYYLLKWSILWKLYELKFWWNHTVLNKPYDDDLPITSGESGKREA